MKDTKYKIAVFTDLKKGSKTLLKNGLGLASMVQGDVEVFHVINSTLAVKTDNQFSALRSMKDEFAASEKKLQNLISSHQIKSSVNIDYRMRLGNVKNEIAHYLKNQRPDIVVLGRRKSNPFDFVGDGLTKWILNEHSGLVMLAPESNSLEPNSKLSLGVLNPTETSFTVEIFEDLLEYVQDPIKTFSFSGATSASPSTEQIHNKRVVRYIFEKGENTLNNLSNYLLKNNINLLWIERGLDTLPTNSNILSKDVKRVIGKVNIPLLMGGNRNTTKQPS